MARGGLVFTQHLTCVHDFFKLNPINCALRLMHAKFSRHIWALNIRISDKGIPFWFPHFILNLYLVGLDSFSQRSLECLAPPCYVGMSWFRLSQFWLRDANLGPIFIEHFFHFSFIYHMSKILGTLFKRHDWNPYLFGDANLASLHYCTLYLDSLLGTGWHCIWNGTFTKYIHQHTILLTFT